MDSNGGPFRSPSFSMSIRQGLVPKRGCLCPTVLRFLQLPNLVHMALGCINRLLEYVWPMGHSSAVSLQSIHKNWPTLATVIAPLVSKGNTVLSLDSWRTMLPSKLQWPQAQQRIEDGGGLPSSALHMSRPTSDPLVSLRSRWFKRLSDTKQCLKIVAALLSGCKEPPLSQEELAPYIDDMIELLGCPPGDHLLAVPPGQPFKLHLWYRLASFLDDSDAHFLLDLVQGVRSMKL